MEDHEIADNVEEKIEGEESPSENEDDAGEEVVPEEAILMHWKSPPVPILVGGHLLWKQLPLETPHFVVQQYVGPIGWLYTVLGKAPSIQSTKAWFRIVSITDNKEVGVSDHLNGIIKMYNAIQTDVEPALQGCNSAQIVGRVAQLVAKLYKQEELQPMLRSWNLVEADGIKELDLDSIIQELRNDNLKLVLSYSHRYTLRPPTNLCCPVCGQPAIDPVETPYFPNQVFCRWCLSFEVQGQTEKFSKPASPRIVRSLDNLEVYCPFTKYGCTTTCRRGELGEHLQHCEFIRLSCANQLNGCDFVTQDQDEALKHMASCKYDAIRAKLAPPAPIATEPSQASPQPSASSAPEASPERKCKFCGKADRQDGKDATCEFHSGTWHGLSFTEMKNRRMAVVAQTVIEGARYVGHMPAEYFKKSTSLGLGVLCSGGLFFATFPYSLLLFLVPPTVAKPIAYNALYSIPRQLLWKSESVSPPPQFATWTCCGLPGSSATPCTTHPYHDFS